MCTLAQGRSYSATFPGELVINASVVSTLVTGWCGGSIIAVLQAAHTVESGRDNNKQASSAAQMHGASDVNAESPPLHLSLSELW